MAASHVLFVVLLASAASASYVRYRRDIDGASSSSGAFSGASSSGSSFSSSTDTQVSPGPGGSGNFNAFAGSGSFSGPPSYGGGSQTLNRGGSDGGGGSQSPFGFPGFNPYVPQYGQQYPYVPFPTFATPFDFMSFLNQYVQSLQNFQAQIAAQAQQAASSGHGFYHRTPGQTSWAFSYPPFVPFGRFPTDTNEVGGVAMATYSPQGGYGAASVYPAPEGALDNRFGNEGGAPQNGVDSKPVGSVSGSFQPPGSSSFGVFTSSSAGSSDVNGKKTSFKQSTIGINDNGKITTYSAHDP